jgi:CCR4-NOT transcription complex subunit 7/8
MYAQDSIELLRHSGIDFAAHAARGIDVRRFGAALLVSGVVLSPDVRWITFHSGCENKQTTQGSGRNQAPGSGD